MTTPTIDDVLAMPEAAEVMAPPDPEPSPDAQLLAKILEERNSYGQAGMPQGGHLVDDGEERDDNEGMGRWYTMTETGAEISSRTLNSVMEDADFSDGLLRQLSMLLDGLARWQFFASCNNRQEHIDALMLEVGLLDQALAFWTTEGNANKLWDPRRDSDLLTPGSDGVYIRQAITHVGLLQRYAGEARIDQARAAMAHLQAHVRKIYAAAGRAADLGVGRDYSYLRDLYAMPVDPGHAGQKAVLAPFFAQELAAVCMASVAGQRAGKWQAGMARILQNFRGGGSIEEQRMSQGFFERRRRDARQAENAQYSAQKGYARAE